jgi:hypothetical protein
MEQQSAACSSEQEQTRNFNMKGLMEILETI